MNLNKFTLEQLSILWIVSHDNIELRKSVEAEFNGRIANNELISREYIFQLSKILNKAIQIYFIPNSRAYTMYGAHAVIEIFLSEAELTEMVHNYSSRPPVNTYGQVKANALVTRNLTTEQISLLATVGFHTNEIASIEMQ